MRKSILTSGLIFLMIALPLFTDALAQSDEDTKSKIEKMNVEMAEAMMNGDYEKGLNYYTDDALSLPNNSPMLKGIEAIKKSNEAMANSGMKVKSFETETIKTISCGDLVIEIGTYVIVLEMEGMEKTINDHGKYVTIWEKQPDGTLKIKIETWNSDINPMGQGSM